MPSARIEIENTEGLISSIWTEPDCQLVQFKKGEKLQIDVSPGGDSVVVRIQTGNDGAPQLILYWPTRCEYSATIDGRPVHLD